MVRTVFKGIFFLFRYFWKQDKRYTFYQLFRQLLVSLVPLTDVIIPKYIIDELTGQRRVEIVCAWIGLMVFINLFGNWLICFSQGKITLIKGRVFTEFQTMMAEKLSRSDYARLEDPKFLDIRSKAERILYGDGAGFGSVLDSAFHIFGKVFTFLGIIVIISTLSIWVVLGFVAIILVNTYFDSKVRRRFVEWDLEKAPVERRTGYFLNLLSDFAFGKEIRIFGLKDWLISREHEHLLESESFYTKQTKLSNKASYLSTLLNFLMKSITYFYLAFCVLGGMIGIGDFTMYVSALMNFSNAMNDLMGSILYIRQFSGYYDALMEYMKVPQQMYDGKRLPVPQGPVLIRFENVSFRYDGQSSYVLRHINLTLHSGEKLSIVGENGAGKTTFVKLLCRLYDPTEGRITLNGTDIRDLDYDAYLKQICSVFQDYKLLAFTLKENVAFQDAETKKDEDIRRILEYSGLGARLSTLPKGVGTNVYRIFTDDGFEPSGGEGQKIALARAIYKNAPIMILDEPTAALDPKAEYEIYQKFSQLTEGKTTLFISHRMSSSRFCDHVALFKDGEIAEYGTHEELMGRNSAYKELFQMQAQYYQE